MFLLNVLLMQISFLKNNNLKLFFVVCSSVMLFACDSSSSSKDKSANAELIGSWYYSDTESDDVTEQFHIVLTFLDSKTYVIATDEADEDDDSGKDGFEIGSYTWSKEGVFEASVRVNNNGEWGFSHPCENEVLRLEVDGDTLQLTADGGVGEGCSGDGGGDVIEFTRVTSESNPMIGSWLLDIDLENNKFALLTLLQDGGYMMVQNDEATDGGMRGIERGYVLFEDESNPDAVIFDIYTDTNGEWGFSHPCAILEIPAPGALNCGEGGADIVQTLEVDGDTLIFISEADTIDNGGDPVELTRVK